MVKPRGIIPSPESWANIKAAVRHIQRHQPVRKARRMPRRRKLGGGGDCSCVTVHEIGTNGAVTGGTVILDVAIDTGSGVVTDDITLNWDDTASEVQTAFEGHSDIAPGDILVKGGPLPDTAVYVVYLSSGNLNRDQSPPTLNTNSLTGTNVRIKTGYMTCHDWEA